MSVALIIGGTLAGLLVGGVVGYHTGKFYSQYDTNAGGENADISSALTGTFTDLVIREILSPHMEIIKEQRNSSASRCQYRMVTDRVTVATFGDPIESVRSEMFQYPRSITVDGEEYEIEDRDRTKLHNVITGIFKREREKYKLGLQLDRQRNAAVGIQKLMKN